MYVNVVACCFYSHPQLYGAFSHFQLIVSVGHSHKIPYVHNLIVLHFLKKNKSITFLSKL